jgi:hypothetical protein
MPNLTTSQIQSVLSEPCEVDPLGIFGEYYLIAKKSFTDFSEAHNKIIMDALYALASTRLSLKAEKELSEARRVMLAEVSKWIDNWDPNFADDDEWPDVAERLAALARKE